MTTYKFYQSIGICPQCRKNELYGSEKLCPECKAYFAEYHAKHPKSQASVDRMKAQKRKLHKQSIIDGICTKCRRMKAVSGKTKCYSCLERERISAQKYRERKALMIK